MADSIDSHVNVSSIVVAGPGTWTNTSNAGTGTVNVVFDAVAPGAPANTITITGTVADDASAGLQIPNTANATWTSLPGGYGTTGNLTGSATTGDPGTATGERTGSGVAPNGYKAATSAPLTLAVPSISKLGPLPVSATIGAATTFDLVVTLPEGTTPDFFVVDHLPAGLAPIGYNLVKSAAASGGRLTRDYPGSLTVTSNGLPAVPAAGDWTVGFGTVTLAPDGDTTDDSFLLQISGRIVNVVGNQSGGHLINTASVGYTDPQSGATTINAAESPFVTVLEPALQVTQTVDNANPRFGDTVKYTLTISHAAGTNSDAFEVALTDTLPPA